MKARMLFGLVIVWFYSAGVVWLIIHAKPGSIASAFITPLIVGLIALIGIGLYRAMRSSALGRGIAMGGVVALVLLGLWFGVVFLIR